MSIAAQPPSANANPAKAPAKARGAKASAARTSLQATRPDAQAGYHRRVRSAHATEIGEDYVEAVADLLDAGEAARVTNLAQRLGVSHVTVVRTVERLAREGLLETEPYQPIRLSASGRRLAERVRRRHELVLKFLLALGVSEEAARADAEGIEHHVSAGTLAAFERFVAERQ
jgi:DtxR family manganese transport transcriptional regulator